MAVPRAPRLAVCGLLPLPPPPLAAQRRPGRGACAPWPSLAHLQRPSGRAVVASAKKLTGVGTDQLNHEGSGGGTISHVGNGGGGNGGGGGGGGNNDDSGYDDDHPRRALALDTLKWLAMGAAVTAALIASLPSAVSHPLGLSATLALANLALPDDVSIQVDRLEAGWHSPLALHGLRLVERSGGSGGGSGSSREGESPNSAPFDPSSSDEEEEEEEEVEEALQPPQMGAAGTAGGAGASRAGLLRRRRRGERPTAADSAAAHGAAAGGPGVLTPLASGSSKRRRVLVSVERISMAQSLWQLLRGSTAQVVIGKPAIDCTLAPSGQPRLLAVLQAVGAAPRAHAMPAPQEPQPGSSSGGGSGGGSPGANGSNPEQQGQQAAGQAAAAAPAAAAAAAKHRQDGRSEGRRKDDSDTDSEDEEAPTLAQAAMAAAAGQAAAQRKSASSGPSSSSSSSSSSGGGGGGGGGKPAISGKQQAAPAAGKPGRAARFGAAASAAAAAAAEAAEAVVRGERARQDESSDSEEEEEAPTLAQAARAARQKSGGGSVSGGSLAMALSPAALLGLTRPPPRKQQQAQQAQQQQQAQQAEGGGGGADGRSGSTPGAVALGTGRVGQGGGSAGGGGSSKGQSWLPESLQHASSAVAITGEVNAGKLQLCISDGALLVPSEIRELLGKHLHLEVLQGVAAIEEAAADDQAAAALGSGSSASASAAASSSSSAGGSGGSGSGGNGRKKVKWARQRPAVLLPWGTGMPQTPVQVRLDGELMKFRLEGWQTARGFVYLVRPIEASMQFTPALSRYLLTLAHPALGGTVGMKGNTVVHASLTPHGGLLPAQQATLRVEPLSVEMNESPVLRQAVGVLGEAVGKLRLGGSVRAELSPIQATLGADGGMRAERLDIRVQTGLGPWKKGLHLVSWGSANLQPPQSLDATLCVPGDALKGLGLPELPDGAGLPLHISGTPDAPKIEIGRASRELALLVATQATSALLKSKGGPQWLADKIEGIAGGTQARGVQMPPPLE